MADRDSRVSASWRGCACGRSSYCSPSSPLCELLVFASLTAIDRWREALSEPASSTVERMGKLLIRDPASVPERVADAVAGRIRQRADVAAFQGGWAELRANPSETLPRTAAAATASIT